MECGRVEKIEDSVMRRIKKFIREHEKLMIFLSFIYRMFACNRVTGKNGLELKWTGTFCKHMKIKNHGKNNKVIIEKGCRFYNCSIEIYGNHNIITIANDCAGHEFEFWASDGSKIYVGEHTHFAGNTHLAATEGKTITIGDRCLFASEIVFRTGDSHSILDLNGNRLNFAKDITVGNHVWIGQYVTVLKGTQINDDTIVGTNSLLTGKTFESNCVVAGNPAKVIKNDVIWHHDLL